MVWTGTGDATASATAIVSVADLNTYIGESDTTDAKAALCAAASAYIAKRTGNLWVSTNYREWIWIDRSADVRVAHSDVTGIVYAGYGTQEGLSLLWPSASTDSAGSTVTYAQAVVTAQTIDASTSISAKLGLSPSSAVAVGAQSTLTLSSYTTMADLDTAATALGWTVGVEQESDPQYLKPGATDNACGATVYLYIPDDNAEVEHIEGAAGVITLACQVNGWVFVHYVAGLGVPPELTQIGCEMCAKQIDTASINTAVDSEKIGDYSYTRSTSASTSTSIGSSDPVLGEFDARLAQYRRMSL